MKKKLPKVKREERIAALEDKAEASGVTKNLLQEKMEVELEKIDAGAARIEGCRLRCKHRPVK